MAIVGQFAWVSRSTSGVALRLAWRVGICPFAKAGKRALGGFAWGPCPEEKSCRAIHIVTLLSTFEENNATIDDGTSAQRGLVGALELGECSVLRLIAPTPDDAALMILQRYCT
jgi:hypothetical protein